MERGELQEAVARLIVDGTYDATADVVAGAAVRVVVAEAQQRIQALGTDWTHVRAGVTSYEPAKAADFKREALAVLAALVPPPPV